MEPINVDTPIAASDYKVLPPKTLLVTSVFRTIQGEGPFAGLPAVFLRLAGCNYGGKAIAGPGCAFCDTFFDFTKGKAYGYKELRSLIEGYGAPISAEASPEAEQNRLLVVTGGEPMLQDALVEFVQGFSSWTWDVQIETNGTRVLPFDLDQENLYIVWSPKVAERKDIHTGLIVSDGYAKASKRILDAADYLKILVSADPKSPYYNLPEFHKTFAEGKDQVYGGRPVYLTPINVYNRAPLPEDIPPNVWAEHDLFDRNANLANHQRAAELATQFGYRVSTQSHLMMGLE